MAIKNSKERAVEELRCFISFSKKARVISFTSKASVLLFATLTGYETSEIKTYFRRSLRFRKEKLIVSE